MIHAMLDNPEVVAMFLETARKALGDRAKASVKFEWDWETESCRPSIIAKVGDGPMSMRHVVLLAPEYTQERADNAALVLSDWIDSLDPNDVEIAHCKIAVFQAR